MEVYLRFAAIATPMLALFVVGLLLYIGSLRKRLVRKAKHNANAKFNVERPFAREGAKQRGGPRMKGEPKFSQPDSNEKVTVSRTTYTGNEIPPEVHEAFKELHGVQDKLFKGVQKVFDAFDHAGKGKQ